MKKAWVLSAAGFAVPDRTVRYGAYRAGSVLKRSGSDLFFEKHPEPIPNREVRSGSLPYHPKSDGMVRFGPVRREPNRTDTPCA